MDSEYVTQAIKTGIWALYGMVWAVVMAANNTRKGKKVTLMWFWANLVIASFIGWTTWHFLPINLWDLRVVLVAWSWFLAYPILDIIEKEW